MNRIAELRRRIAAGEYVVDAAAVADAILRQAAPPAGGARSAVLEALERDVAAVRRDKPQSRPRADLA